MLTKDGKSLLICASDDDTVQILDVATARSSATCPQVRTLSSSTFIPPGSPVYVANEDDSLITAIDLEDAKVLAEVPVGVEPEGVGVSPDGKILIATSETSNMAHFIDTDSYRGRRQRAGRIAATLCRVHRRRDRSSGSPRKWRGRCR